MNANILLEPITCSLLKDFSHNASSLMLLMLCTFCPSLTPASFALEMGMKRVAAEHKGVLKNKTGEVL